MSDDFEPIIRYFAKSSAMSDGLMAFCERWNAISILFFYYSITVSDTAVLKCE